MNRRLVVIGLIVATLIAATAVGLYTRSASGGTPGAIAVAGHVRADESIVRAPAIMQPTPDFTVGLKTDPASAQKRRPAAGAATASATASHRPVVSGFLAEVLVTEGAHVTTGQMLARLDTSTLDLGVQGAEAAAAKGRADLDVLDANEDKLHDARATLSTARRKLTAARASLSATLTVLVRQRATLETSIAAIQALIAQPGGPPPHAPPYPVLLAALRSALKNLNTGLGRVRAGLATINRNLAKVASGIAQVDSGLRRLRDARDLLRIDVRARAVAVRIAKARRDAAEITSPASGVVTFALRPGTAVMVGAPVVCLREEGPTRIDTYLTATQLADVEVGTPVTVDFDSNTGSPVPGRVERIGDTSVVPPTAFPTTIVHMTRAVPVTIVLEEGRTAPAGTPVDIEIGTASARAGGGGVR